MSDNTSDEYYGLSIDKLFSLASSLAQYQEETISPDYWHGYFTAIAASPMLLPEDSWLSLVFNEKEHNDELKEHFRDLLKDITSALHNKTYHPYFPGNIESWRYCTLSDWCDGFLTASYLWPEDIQAKAGEELVMVLLPIIVFQDPDEYFHNNSYRFNDQEWEEFLDKCFSYFEHCLFELLILWQEVVE